MMNVDYETEPRRSNQRDQYHRSDNVAFSTVGYEDIYAYRISDPPELDDEVAPPYELVPRRLGFTHSGSHTEATITDEGRVNITFDPNGHSLSKLLEPALQNQVEREYELTSSVSTLFGGRAGNECPALNIVMQAVGSRGDIQPFISVALRLQTFGHRVRVATHQIFQPLVEEAGLEFFNIGGDPTELMVYMVRNPGLLPNMDAFLNGDIRKNRKAVREMLEGCWRSCIEAGDGTRADPTLWKTSKPFVADAIISNPPAFAHIHCAEKLGVPLHLMFTMPWSPTQAFAHPLANIQIPSPDTGFANYVSYVLVEMMTWQGIGNVINSFRRNTLELERIDLSWAPGMLARLKIPHTYLWSPSLKSKPKDWGCHINIAGFCFLPPGVNYIPPMTLVSFIQNGPLPVYIGFGSIVVDDPQALTATILEATRLAGVKAIVSQGWSTLGATKEIPPNVFVTDDCPHDWLFKHVACVVHHGGAGTTAAAIAAGKPSVVVPFFGDQPFWGNILAQTGAASAPIPSKSLTAAALAAAITDALAPSISENARTLATTINAECGANTAAWGFHSQLPLSYLCCSLIPQRAAVWRYQQGEIKLSALAATTLKKEGLIRACDLDLYRSCEYDLGHGPWDPVSGGVLAISGLLYNVFRGLGEIGSDLARLSRVIEASDGARSKDTVMYSTYSPNKSSLPLSATDGKTLGSGSLKGVGRIVKTTLRSPMAFSWALAQGAHNAPRMWGDKTVRPQDKITGLRSGLVAAGEELFLGTYDGVAGLFIQPYIGARDEGILGAIKGFAKGIAGTPTKFFAAMSGTVGYSLKGVDAAISKVLSSRNCKATVGVRLAQGEQEYLEASADTKKEIMEQWRIRTPTISNC